MIDTHCHLNHPQLMENASRVLLEAAKAGVDKLIVPAWDEDSSYNTMSLAAKYPEIVYPAIGVHPWFPPVNGISFVEDICRSASPVAIGEIGLDKSSRNPLNDQIIIFKSMINIAKKYDLPVIIHARGGWDIILEILHEIPVRGVMHAFSGSLEVMRQFIHAGMLISFASVLTRPNNKKNQLCAASIPLHNMMIETDAPGMSIHGTPRGKGTPENLPIVAGAMAEIRGIPIHEIMIHSDANARELFRIKL